MIDGFYKVKRNQSLSFCVDIFYNPQTHEWYRLTTSDSDDYGIMSHWWKEHEEPLDTNVASLFNTDYCKKQIRKLWQGGYER